MMSYQTFPRRARLPIAFLTAVALVLVTVAASVELAQATEADGSSCEIPGIDDRCETWSAIYDDPSVESGSYQLEPRVAASADGRRVFVSAINQHRNADDPSASPASWTVLGYDGATGAERWQASFSGPGNYDRPNAITASRDGSLVVATGGSYDAPLMMAKDRDLMTIAYSGADGSELWRAHSPGPARDVGTEVLLSHDEQQVFVVVNDIVGKGDIDWAVAAYKAADGQQLWRTPYRGLDIGKVDSPKAAALSPSGDLLYVTGESEATKEYDADYATVAYATTGPAAGTVVWESRYDAGKQLSDRASDLSVDAEGRVIVTGNSLRNNEVRNVDIDYATIAYDGATGEQLWEARYAGPANDGLHFGRSVATSPTGTVAVVSGQSVNAERDSDWMTLAYDTTTGTELWQQRLTTPNHKLEFPMDTAISPDGTRAVVTGVSGGTNPTNYRDLNRSTGNTVSYSIDDGSLEWSARLTGDDDTDSFSPRAVVLRSDGGAFTVGQLTNNVQTDESDNLYDAMLVSYLDAAGTPTPEPTESSPSPSPTPSATPPPTESPTPTPTETATPTPTPSATSSPTPTPTATSTPPSDSTFTAEGDIIVSNPSASITGGVTEDEFAITCNPAPETQGLDGYVFQLPDSFVWGRNRAAVSGSNALDFYDLDLAFYSAECKYLGASATEAADEVSDLPDGTKFVVVNAFLGNDTHVVLKVTTTEPAPTTSPTTTASPTVSPTTPPSPGGERRAYPTSPDDTYFGQQWGPAKINAPEAWQEDQATGHGVNVAVIDSGLDLTHPDFACTGKVGRGAAVIGGEVLYGEPAQDIDGHGTHVAGIVGACTDNGIGTVGVAPDSSIRAYRVFTTEDEEDGELNDIAVAIKQAADDGAHVINMSLGIGIGAAPFVGGAIGYLEGLFPKIDDAIEYAQAQGVVVVIAAGNSGVLPLCEYPAIAEDAICVGATDRNDFKAWYGTFPNKADDDDIIGPSLSAPGGQGTFCEQAILSTYLRNPSGRQFCSPEDGYDAIDGTSMAAPHVAGVAALLYDRLGASRSAANRAAITDALLESSVDLGTPGYDPVFGYGRVDALAAVKAVAPVAHPTDEPTDEPTKSASPTPTPTDESTEGPDPTTPAAPSNATARAASSSRIEIAWADNSDNETGFTIERSRDGSRWSEIATADRNQTFYLDMGLEPGTTYSYRVRAMNPSGYSGYSNSASATTMRQAPSGHGAASAPATPTELRAASSSPSRIELAWRDNSGNEDGFALERSLNGSTWQEIATTARNQASYLDSGLEAGTRYHYRVRAYNSAGHSPYSSTAAATTKAAPEEGPQKPSPEPSESGAPVTGNETGTATTSLGSSKRLVKYGSGFELSGVVQRDEACSGPLEVEVSRRVHGTTSFEAQGSTTVSGSGAWGLQVTGEKNSAYVAQVKETDTCRGEASAPADVFVRAKLSLKAPKRCRGVVRGRLEPSYPGSKVKLQKKIRKGWKNIGKRMLDPDSRFKFRPGKCGLYRVTWAPDGAPNEAARARLRIR